MLRSQPIVFEVFPTVYCWTYSCGNVDLFTKEEDGMSCFESEPPTKQFASLSEGK